MEDNKIYVYITTYCNDILIGEKEYNGVIEEEHGMAEEVTYWEETLYGYNFEISIDGNEIEIEVKL